jgi:hypothetical protein
VARSLGCGRLVAGRALAALVPGSLAALGAGGAFALGAGSLAALAGGLLALGLVGVPLPVAATTAAAATPTLALRVAGLGLALGALALGLALGRGLGGPGALFTLARRTTAALLAAGAATFLVAGATTAAFLVAGATAATFLVAGTATAVALAAAIAAVAVTTVLAAVAVAATVAAVAVAAVAVAAIPVAAAVAVAILVAGAFVAVLDEEEEEGLLGVEAVLGLVEDGGAGAVEEGGGDLLVADGGEAVHDDGLGEGEGEEVLVDLEAGEGGAAGLGLGLVAHGDPGVGVDGVDARDGLFGVGGDGDALGDLGEGLEALGGGDADLDAEELAHVDEGARDVVLAVADVGDLQALEVVEALAEGEEVSERLAGMVPVGEGVDHRDRGALDHLLEGLVGVDPGHDGVAVAGHDGGEVEGVLAAAELGLTADQLDHVAAQLAHPDGEGDAGADGGLLHVERDVPAAQLVAAATLGAVSLELPSEPEQGLDLGGGQVLSAKEMFLLSHGLPRLHCGEHRPGSWCPPRWM